MSLTPEAESLAMLDELAQECALCFAGARCAGADLTAIGQTARAAVILGAPLSAIQAQVPPYASDVQYLDQVEVIREALQAKMAELRAFIRKAQQTKRTAADGMRRAIRERKYAMYLYYLEIYRDAAHAARIAHHAKQQCHQADRCLAWARVRFAEAYEGAESDVARGVRLPHEGRWIGGENQPARASLSVVASQR